MDYEDYEIGDYDFVGDNSQSSHSDSAPDHEDIEISDASQVPSNAKDIETEAKECLLQMCSKHKPGNMVEVCKVCSAALAWLGPKWPNS